MCVASLVLEGECGITVVRAVRRLVTSTPRWGGEWADFPLAADSQATKRLELLVTCALAAPSVACQGVAVEESSNEQPTT